MLNAMLNCAYKPPTNMQSALVFKPAMNVNDTFTWNEETNSTSTWNSKKTGCRDIFNIVNKAKSCLRCGDRQAGWNPNVLQGRPEATLWPTSQNTDKSPIASTTPHVVIWTHYHTESTAIVSESDPVTNGSLFAFTLCPLLFLYNSTPLPYER